MNNLKFNNYQSKKLLLQASKNGFELLNFEEVMLDDSRNFNSVKKKEMENEGKLPVIDQGGKYIAGYTNRFDEFQMDNPRVIFGDHTRILKFVDFPFVKGADGTKILKNKTNDNNLKYFYYYLRSIKLPNDGYSRHFKYIKNLIYPVPNYETQTTIVEVLDSVQGVIVQKNKQLQELDNLIQSIFFDTINNNNYKEISFGDAFDLIDGDRGKKYPKKSEFMDNGYCLFLNTKNVTKNGFSFENKEFISKEKDEVLRSGKVEYGDFILTTRGTVGNIAYYDEKIPYENIRINSGMLILRPKIEIDEQYFQILIRELPLLELALSGSAQPQLPKGKLSELVFPVIDKSKQLQFSGKVKEIESVKEKMENSLNEMKLLFNALMQKAFTGELV